MKKNIGSSIVSPLGIAVLSGCSSVEWTQIEYTTPANEINLKKSASIRIVAANDNPENLAIANYMSKSFAQSGQFKIDEKNPDYWIVIDSARKFRTDDQQAALFNRKVEKVSISDKSGGKEVIKVTDYKSSSASAFLSVAVYSIKELIPVYYFDVAVYDSDFLQKNVRSREEYYKMFTKQFIEKFNDSFLTQKRMIETAIPKKADSALKDALLSGNAQGVIDQAKARIPDDFDKFMADVYKGKYKDQEDLVESKLNDYYILALAQEMGSFDIGKLKELHKQHVAILNLTKSSGLITACPNSIARIESKLKLLQALK